MVSLPFVFGKQYGWNETQTGLSYLGLSAGSLTGLVLVYLYSDRISVVMAQRKGVKSPEVVGIFSFF